MNNDNTYGDIKKYWYDSNEYIVYDYENNYPIDCVKYISKNTATCTRRHVNMVVCRWLSGCPSLAGAF